MVTILLYKKYCNLDDFTMAHDPTPSTSYEVYPENI